MQHGIIPSYDGKCYHQPVNTAGHTKAAMPMESATAGRRVEPFDYQAAPVVVRPDIAEAHRKAWQRLARAGNWWSGAERIAIAAEMRGARTCSVCRDRKAALSPAAVDREHESCTDLPKPAIDAIHRMSTDPGRLTKAWYESKLETGLTPEQYVEIVGVVVTVISVDTFHLALGLPLEPLPEPVPGEPTRYRPPGATQEGAWVPTIPSDRLTEAEADIYHGSRGFYVIRAMSLVPDEVRMLDTLSKAHYLPHKQVGDPASSGNRAISRPQIELLAARVSAVNQCFY